MTDAAPLFAIAFLIHTLVAIAVGFCLASFNGALNAPIAAVALLAGLIAAWALVGSYRDDWCKLKSVRSLARSSELHGSLIETMIVIFAFAACVRHFFWMLYPADHHFMSLDANNLGDLPVHINYIRQFANGAQFPPRNPGYSLDLLRYPFGVDFYSALLESIGLRLQFHLFLFGAAASWATLWFLRRWGSWWAVGALFFSGGIMGWDVLLAGRMIYDWQSLVEWKSLLTTVWITQRGFLIGLPLGLFLIQESEFQMSSVQESRPVSRFRQLFFAIAWGLLPLIHAHSFIVVSMMMAGRLVGVALSFKSFVRFCLRSAHLVTVAIAGFFIWRATSGLERAGVAHWRGFWMAPSGQEFWFFWINFGFWLVIPIAIPVALWVRRQSRESLRFLFCSWGIDIFCLALFLNLMLAPWDWDNIKLLIWPFIGLARTAGAVFEPMLETSSRGWLKWPIACALFFSGVMAVSVSLGPANVRAVAIYGAEELNATAGALRTLPREAVDRVFAAAPTYQHSLTYFGRLRVLDYEGHVWSHGIHYQPVMVDLSRLMNGDADWRGAARRIGADFIFWGPQERLTYGDGERPWMKELQNVSRVEGYGIYELTK